MNFGIFTVKELAPAAIALLLLPLAGCGGSDRAGIEGTLVRQDGSPLVGAKVVARSRESGDWASGVTDEEGYFELGTAQEGDGIPSGDYYVIVMEDVGDMDNRRPPTIAQKYRSPESSGISVSLEPGEDAVLDLTLDPP